MRDQATPISARASVVASTILLGTVSLGLGLLLGLLAAPVGAQTGSGAIDVAHAAVDEVGTVGPDQTITFSVSVTNNSGGPLQNLTVRVATDELVFAEATPAESEPPGQVLDGGLQWAIPLLEEGLTASRRYQVTTTSSFTAAEATNRALVFGTDGAQVAEAPVTLSVGDPFQSITVVAEPNEVDAVVSPGEAVGYTVTITADQEITDPVAVRFKPDSGIFGTAQATVDASPTGWATVGTDLSTNGFAAGQAQRFVFTVEADSEFSDEATVALSAIEVELGAVAKSFPIETPLASVADTITVSHARVDHDEAVLPGSTVAYLITVTNGDDRSVVENLRVSVTPPAGLAVGDIDPSVDGEADQPPNWTLDRLAAGDERRFRYELLVPEEPTGASIGVIKALVEFDGGSEAAETEQVELAVGAELLTVDHRLSTEISQLAPSATVEYSVVVRNTSALPVTGIRLSIEVDNPAVQQVQPINPDPTSDCDEPDWCFDLEPGDSATRSYRIVAAGSFGESQAPVVTVAEVEVAEGDSTIGEPKRKPSDPPLSLTPPPVAVVDTPTLEADSTFILTVVFLLMSFVSVTFLVVSRRAQSARSDLGRSLFTVISLLSATLILAFGTNLQSEAISLLAAIAGYVLGQGTADRHGSGDGDAGPAGPGGTPLPVAAPGAGPGPGEGDDQTGARATGEVDTVGVAIGNVGQRVANEAGLAGGQAAVGQSMLADGRRLAGDGGGVVATGVNELRRLSQERRITSLSLLSIALLSPVLIVLATVWLVDSTGTFEVTWPTYVSAGSIALLLLVFLSGVAYLSGTDAGGSTPMASTSIATGGPQAGPGDGDTGGGERRTDDGDETHETAEGGPDEGD